MRCDSLTVSLAIVFALFGGAIARAQGVSKPAPAYDLVVVGDVMLGRLVGKELDVNRSNPWVKVADVFPTAQLQIGNFEAAVSGVGLQCVHPGDLCLTTAPENLGLLSRAGFTHLGLANNHAADLGVDGKENTRAKLLVHGLEPLDADRHITFADANGLRIALVAISLVPDALGHAVRIPSIALSQKLALARALSDKVVVIVHWGNELQPWASQQQRDAAHWLIAQGADMIFGHHPHVVQAAECVEGRPVWFSLGNHIFDQKYVSTHTGAMAACRFSRDSDDTTCDGYLTSRTQDSAVIDKLSSDPTHSPLTCSPPRKSDVRMNLTATAGDSPDTYDLFEGKTASPGTLLATPLPLRKLLRMGLPGGESALLMLLALVSPFDKTLGLRPHVYRQKDGRLEPLWRGSALAYPIEDLIVQKDKAGEDVVCVLHEPVSHLGRVRMSLADHLVLAYRWTGFGFNVDSAPDLTSECARAYGQL